MSGCWGRGVPAPGMLQHGPAGGTRAAPCYRDVAAGEAAGHAGRAATWLNKGYSCLPGTWPGNRSSSMALEGGCGVTGREESALPGGRRMGGMWRALC